MITTCNIATKYFWYDRVYYYDKATTIIMIMTVWSNISNFMIIQKIHSWCNRNLTVTNYNNNSCNGYPTNPMQSAITEIKWKKMKFNWIDRVPFNSIGKGSRRGADPESSSNFRWRVDRESNLSLNIYSILQWNAFSAPFCYCHSFRWGDSGFDTRNV